MTTRVGVSRQADTPSAPDLSDLLSAEEAIIDSRPGELRGDFKGAEAGIVPADFSPSDQSLTESSWVEHRTPLHSVGGRNKATPTSVRSSKGARPSVRTTWSLQHRLGLRVTVPGGAGCCPLPAILPGCG